MGQWRWYWGSISCKHGSGAWYRPREDQEEPKGLKTPPGLNEVGSKSSGMVIPFWMNSEVAAILGSMDVKVEALMTMTKEVMGRLDEICQPKTIDLGVERLTIKKIEETREEEEEEKDEISFDEGVKGGH